jgi:hypothetical protein
MHENIVQFKKVLFFFLNATKVQPVGLNMGFWAFEDKILISFHLALIESQNKTVPYLHS